MKKIKLVTVLIFLFVAVTVNLVSAQQSVFSYEKFTNDKGDTLNYRRLYPDYDTLRKYPLVIFLHGSGERGNDNEAQLKWGVMNFATDQNMIKYPAIVIAPQCPEKMGWANFSNKKNSREKLLQPTPSKPMELLIELVHQIIKKLPVDTNRIYITGLSMGGHGTYDAIERYPELFAAAVPVCGGGDVTRASSIAHIPIWIFAGAEDAAVNPLYSLDMVEALFKAGAHPGFTQYPAVGHFSWLGAYSDPLMMEWLFRQHK
ncbi:prolyl oligopeptidase family serine peptidase [Ginsengibacter hankyongi]|uniref:Prolyl oligopeptidase family serine peptidase n=1 Tax=Ginsengibacter hankyongi TaxID=2607284 RepID=A0A5J5IJA3_9BACT|nr:prolyl oligopeptidase family serine peptidase [Ginsengibacter hankyongi]KAA9041145.1 prolyl oligopeptidase family serine peptidase [Ginsengibacter hankyongi]